jgi:hypothetical protein
MAVKVLFMTVSDKCQLNIYLTYTNVGTIVDRNKIL